ncbi:amidohydrolase [Nakamurella antarctica]|uniref:amidohydrolase n=1 Tax=Nakamurella antarctica TaxID=1902245 RepID=UPI0019D1834D|nr:amidohydrolase family protein [Nakamurella antarctica]
MTTTLLRGGRIHTAYDPAATAIAITDGVISWIGAEHGIEQAGHIDRTVDLGGLFVAPAFIDSHVHSADAGLALTGLDLSAAQSLPQCLDHIRGYAKAHPAAVIWGHGWDESGWPEKRWPTLAEIDAVVGDRVAYFARVDVHSALVSSRVHRQLDPSAVGFSGDGPLTQISNLAARDLARAAMPVEQCGDAQRAFLDHCARHGIVEVHECGFPDPRSLSELRGLLSMANVPVAVRGYLAAAVTDPQEARELLLQSGAHALAGDLSVDGAIGSTTASLCAPYLDAASRGNRYLGDDAITEHLVACALAGIQPGFHAIGDDAVDAVAAGLRRAAERLGPNGSVALAAVTPRIEHAEMVGPEAIATFAATGTVASVQPLFDALWGGEAGMYSQRLGGERAGRMNPFAALASAGVTLALGSDAPVTPADPWAAVQAAVHHRTPGFGLSSRGAFTAHTRGAHRAAGRVERGVGTISVGAPADIAIWQAGELVRPVSAEKLSRWSTDPKSRVPLLPDLMPGNDLPSCVATISAGKVTFDGSGLLESGAAESQLL